jgi:diamine N-acetyltransferase
VGFVMHGVDPDDESAWIGGLVIDRAHQRRGVGRAVVDLLVARAAAEGRASALSYEPANAVAKSLYERAGFAETGERDGAEVVARRPLTSAERLR